MNMVPRSAKSMDRSVGQASDENPDNNYITNIDVIMDRAHLTAEDEEVEYRRPDPEPTAVQDDNELVYGVVPMPNNNVKIVLRKPQRKVKEGGSGRQQASIVHINSQMNSAPYCCTGNDMRSNEIRIVVNQR